MSSSLFSSCRGGRRPTPGISEGKGTPTPPCQRREHFTRRDYAPSPLRPTARPAYHTGGRRWWARAASPQPRWGTWCSSSADAASASCGGRAPACTRVGQRKRGERACMHGQGGFSFCHLPRSPNPLPPIHTPAWAPPALAPGTASDARPPPPTRHASPGPPVPRTCHQRQVNAIDRVCGNATAGGAGQRPPLTLA